jgi:photosystem II stability/assembly factor-like uncharacterized protein
MTKKLIPFLLLILVLTGCNRSTPTLQYTVSPTIIPSTAIITATATPIPPTSMPPTKTPISGSPTATTIPASTNPIQHFPSGQKLTITFIHMLDSNAGWAVGGLTSQGDHVVYTSDGGSTWKDVTPPEAEAASGEQKNAIGFFQDAQTAWVTYGYSGFIIPTQAFVWHTADGGVSWQSSHSLDTIGFSENFSPSDLFFVGGQAGWLLAHVGAGMNHDYVVLYHSTDGGITWKRLIDPDIDAGIQFCHKTGMLFTDAKHGWLTGDCNSVAPGVWLFKSSDAGASWQEVELPDPAGSQGLFTDQNAACGASDPFFFSNDLGHLSVTCYNFMLTPMTYTYYLYTTRDGGATWTSSTYPGEALFFISADIGWAISQQIQLTTNGGATWTPVKTIDWNAQIDFISEQIGWGVATAGDVMALVKTDNGGARWSELNPVVGP